MLGRFFNLTKKSNLNGRLEYDWKHFLVIWWFTFLCHLYSLYKTSGGFANFSWGCLPSPSSRFLPSSSFPFQIPPVLLDVGVDLLYCSCWIWVSAVINQSIKNLSEQMQKHCSHCTSIWEEWGDITWCREITVKKVSLSLWLNVDSVPDDITSDGRLFQFFTGATQNARSPTVWKRVCATKRSAVSSHLEGSGAEPQPKSIFLHFCLKIWHLMAIFSLFSWESTDQLSCRSNRRLNMNRD